MYSKIFSNGIKVVEFPVISGGFDLINVDDIRGDYLSEYLENLSFGSLDACVRIPKSSWLQVKSESGDFVSRNYYFR